MTDAPRDPWERRADETERAWVAFQTYRDLEPGDRSLAEAARRIYGPRGVQKNGMVVGRVREWSVRYDWRDRAAAWDAEVDRRRREALMGGHLRAAERHVRQAEAGARAMMVPIQALLRRVHAAGGDAEALQDLGDEELVRLARMAGRTLPALAKMERLGRGLPEDVSELREGGDGEADWLRALLADPEAREALDEIAAEAAEEEG